MSGSLIRAGGWEGGGACQGRAWRGTCMPACWSACKPACKPACTACLHLPCSNPSLPPLPVLQHGQADGRQPRLFCGGAHARRLPCHHPGRAAVGAQGGQRPAQVQVSLTLSRCQAVAHLPGCYIFLPVRMPTCLPGCQLPYHTMPATTDIPLRLPLHTAGYCLWAAQAGTRQALAAAASRGPLVVGWAAARSRHRQGTGRAEDKGTQPDAGHAQKHPRGAASRRNRRSECRGWMDEMGWGSEARDINNEKRRRGGSLGIRSGDGEAAAASCMTRSAAQPAAS